MSHVNDCKLQALIDQGYGPGGTALLDNLVAWWSMDEVSGTRVDSHGVYDLTDINGTGSTVGKVDNAAQFNAASLQYFQIPFANLGQLNFGDSSFSIMGWTRRDSDFSNACFCGIWTEGAGTPSYLLNFEVGRAGRLRWVVNTSSGVENLEHPTIVPVGVLTCVIAYYDQPAQELGISLDRGAFTTLNIPGAIVSGTSNFSFSNYGGGTYSDQTVDEVAVYSGKVTTEQMDEFWNGGNGTGYPG